MFVLWAASLEVSAFARSAVRLKPDYASTAPGRRQWDETLLTATSRDLDRPVGTIAIYGAADVRVPNAISGRLWGELAESGLLGARTLLPTKGTIAGTKRLRQFSLARPRDLLSMAALRIGLAKPSAK